MANKLFRGDAQDVPQVDTLTVAGVVAAANQYTVIQNLKEITYTAIGTETNDEIAAALFNLLNGTDIPEYNQLSYANTTNVITVTGPDDGRPFTLTTSVVGTGTLTQGTTTVARGKNHWDDVDNWSPVGIPVNGDVVYLRDSATDILYGIDQSAVTLLAFNQESTYTGRIGLPKFNGQFFEYLNDYLKIGITTCNLGIGAGSGLQRFKWNAGAVATTFNVFLTGSPETQGIPSILFLGTNAANVLNIDKGSMGVCYEEGGTSTFSTIRTGYLNSQSTDVNLELGTGLTLTNLIVNGGTITIRVGLTTLTLHTGTINFVGSATTNITTLTAYSGLVYWSTSGTITAVTLNKNAKIDFSRDSRSRTITSATLRGDEFDYNIYDPARSVVFSNPVTFSGCSSNKTLWRGVDYAATF